MLLEKLSCTSRLSWCSWIDVVATHEISHMYVRSRMSSIENMFPGTTVHPVKMGASSTRIWEASCDVQTTDGAGRGVGANMKNGSVSDRWVRSRWRAALAS